MQRKLSCPHSCHNNEQQAHMNLCEQFNKATDNGKDMGKISQLLEDAIMTIIDAKDESDIDSFFGGGQTTFLSGGFSGLDDFELICFMVVIK